MDSKIVAPVSLKLPPYWPADPYVWFAQVEAQFGTRGITAERTQYDYIISALTPEIAQEVRDLLLEPPKDTPYATLKAELIKRTTATEQKRLQQLLTDEVLGDRKPTQLLRHMRQLLGDRALEESILRQLFLQRLPSNVQMVLTSTGDSMQIEKLAELADKVIDVAVQPHTSVSFVTPPPPAVPPTIPSVPVDLRAELDLLRSEVSRLTLKLQTVTTHPSRSRSRHRQHRSRSRTPAPSPDDTADMCWYHANFGDRARKCHKPCSYTGNDNASN